MTRKVPAREIQNKVKKLFFKANIMMRPDIKKALEKAYAKERSVRSRYMLKILLDNAEIAKKEKLPLCQDTGLAVIFVEMGCDVRVTGGGIMEALNRGVEEAYTEYNFRKSVVMDPVSREYRNTNTPAVAHLNIVKGSGLRITVMPKGFGSENKSRIMMLDPVQIGDAVTDFCVETVKLAGADACPPYVLGVGVGGTMDLCALLAKKALLKPLAKSGAGGNSLKLGKRILKQVNSLGIGVMGLGGECTALGVNIEMAPTHIAGCPVAVALSCHSLRSASGMV